MPNVTEIVEHGDPIIVDGDTGEVLSAPAARRRGGLCRKGADARAQAGRSFARCATCRPSRLDGVEIGLQMNAGLLVDMPHLDETGAESIGLFRTELQFMLASRFPRPGAQEQLYRSVLDAAGDRPVTFRTLDIGGDKVLPYMKARRGESGARLARDAHRPRPPGAAAHAAARPYPRRRRARSADHDADGLDRRRIHAHAGACFDRELEWSASHGHEPPRTAKLGVMVEVPSLLWQLDEIAADADFLSVGSNDLMQYLYAVDRDNRGSPTASIALCVGFLRALRSIVEAGARAGTPVTLCGEIGGRPLEAMALIGARLPPALHVGDLDRPGQGDDL